MTAYEFFMPLTLLALAGLYTLYVRHESDRLDARLERARSEKNPAR